MRMFIAFDLPAATKAAIAAALEPLEARHHLRWARVEGMHLTVVFLGEVDETRLDELRADLDRAALLAGPFTLHLEGTGTFGREATPRVLWLGVEGDLGPARTLEAFLRTELEVPDEGREWTPHLTLARAKSPRGDAALNTVAKALADFDAGDVTVEALTLFESRGGHYFVQHTAPLRGGARR